MIVSHISEAVAMEVCESREEPRNAMGQMEDDSVVHMEIDHELYSYPGVAGCQQSGLWRCGAGC